MFEERHLAAGSFDVTISGEAPNEMRFPDWDVDTDHDYRLFSWLVITPSRIHDPGLTASSLWAASQFTGVVREFTVEMDGTVTLGGASIHVLLGNENGHGPSRNNVNGDGGAGTRKFSTDFWIAGTDGFFSTNNLRVNGLTAGTVYDDFTYTYGVFTIGGTPSGGIQDFSEYPVTATALRKELDALGYDHSVWRVNPDLTVDFGLETGSMYRQIPLAMVWDGPSGTEGSLALMRAESASYDVDGSDFATYSRFHYSSGWASTSQGTVFPGGVTNPAPLYYDIGGSNALRIDVNDGSEGMTSATEAQSERRLNQQEHGIKYDLSVQVESRPDLRNYVRAGDNISAWFPRMGILDTANQLVASGRVVHPMVFQCSGLRRPITKGMGVYVIDNFDQTVHDVSDYVIFEDGPTTIDIGKRYTKPRTWQRLVGGWNRKYRK